MEIKFEKNIPLPKLRGGSVELQDALARMEVEFIGKGEECL